MIKYNQTSDKHISVTDSSSGVFIRVQTSSDPHTISDEDFSDFSDFLQGENQMIIKKPVYWLAFFPRFGGKHLERALFFDHQFAMIYGDKLAEMRGSYEDLIVYRRDEDDSYWLNKVEKSSVWVQLSGELLYSARRDLETIRGSYQKTDLVEVSK